MNYECLGYSNHNQPPARPLQYCLQLLEVAEEFIITLLIIEAYDLNLKPKAVIKNLVNHLIQKAVSAVGPLEAALNNYHTPQGFMISNPPFIGIYVVTQQYQVSFMVEFLFTNILDPCKNDKTNVHMPRIEQASC